ncbi:MAG: glycosyltransferase family 39 protein [Pseudohongiellaceae bacterium]|nr:glycosyltransferase family 39 protein [Pseudohongiellaceae bacterium]
MRQDNPKLNTKALFIGGFAAIVIVKLIFATKLDLYSDEIFYWQASTHPAIAYSDLPFMASLLTGLGANLLGHTPLAVRALFLLMGCSIPFLVYWIAKGLVPQRQALEASALSLCIPLCSFLGLLAVPDVPLVFFGLLLIGSLERATRLDLKRYWLLAGLAAALGVSTHYRFAIYLLSALVFLTIFKDQRQHWRRPGLWIAATLVAIGLFPTLYFNLQNSLGGLDYHLLDRHPWEFQAEGLLHPFKQALLVTPFLYILLIVVLIKQLKAASNGDSRKGLIAIFALFNLGVYLILAPWTDSTRTSIHWPLSGYLPLLVYLPQTLRTTHSWLVQHYPKGGNSLFKVGIAIGFAGSMGAIVGIGSQSMQNTLQPLLGQDVLSTKMTGWPNLVAKVKDLQLNGRVPADALIVADNYYTSAQLEFGLGRRDIYNIDLDKAIRDGRAIQYALWLKDINGLRQNPGASALLVVEDSTLTSTDKIATLQRACAEFESLQFIGSQVQFNGAKKYSFYIGHNIGGNEANQRCPLPSLGWVDQPIADARVTDSLTVSGWIVNEGLGVESVEVLINGKSIGMAIYGNPRPDVAEIMNIQDDPNLPNLGYSFSISTSDLPKGEQELTLKTTGKSGESQIFGLRQITIE